MNRESTQWYCHGCKRKGNAVTFLAQYENISPQKATRFLREAFGTDYRPPVGGMRAEFEEFIEGLHVEPRVFNPPIDERFQEEFQDSLTEQAISYLEGRGFDNHTIKDAGFGWDAKSERITIPIRNLMTELIGFKGRSITKEHMPKYLVIGDRPNRPTRYGFPTYEVSWSLFGCNMFPQEDVNHVYIVEGELDAIAMHMRGKYAVALGGGNFSDRQAQLIRSLGKRAVVFMDWDKAGNRATINIAEKLHPFMPVDVIGEHEGDPASMTDAELEKTLLGPMNWTQLMIES